MTWTVICKNPSDNLSLTTEIVHGIWGKKETLLYLEENLNSEVIAIVPGEQVVYFNDPVVNSLLEK